MCILGHPQYTCGPNVDKFLPNPNQCIHPEVLTCTLRITWEWGRLRVRGRLGRKVGRGMGGMLEGEWGERCKRMHANGNSTSDWPASACASALLDIVFFLASRQPIQHSFLLIICDVHQLRVARSIMNACIVLRNAARSNCLRAQGAPQKMVCAWTRRRCLYQSVPMQLRWLTGAQPPPAFGTHRCGKT